MSGQKSHGITNATKIGNAINIGDEHWSEEEMNIVGLCLRHGHVNIACVVYRFTMATPLPHTLRRLRHGAIRRRQRVTETHHTAVVAGYHAQAIIEYVATIRPPYHGYHGRGAGVVTSIPRNGVGGLLMFGICWLPPTQGRRRMGYVMVGLFTIPYVREMLLRWRCRRFSLSTKTRQRVMRWRHASRLA